MKLESKLGLSTGFLVMPCFSVRTRQHVACRGQPPRRRHHHATASRSSWARRDLRSHFTDSIRALESYMLFGIDPASSPAYRHARRSSSRRPSLNGQASPGKRPLRPRLRRHASSTDLDADSPPESPRREGRSPQRIEDLAGNRAGLRHTSRTKSFLSKNPSSQTPAISPSRRWLRPMTRSCSSASPTTPRFYTLWLATIFGALFGGSSRSPRSPRSPRASISSPNAPTPSPQATSPAEPSTSTVKIRSARSP